MRKFPVLLILLIGISLLFSGCAGSTLSKRFEAARAPVLLDEIEKNTGISIEDKALLRDAFKNIGEYHNFEGQNLRYVMARHKEVSRFTLSKYTSIREGMNYQEVYKIMGHPGVEASQSSIAGYKHSVFVWQNSDDRSNMMVYFTNNQVVGKAQAGLK